jgi:hypothetical protein
VRTVLASNGMPRCARPRSIQPNIDSATVWKSSPVWMWTCGTMCRGPTESSGMSMNVVVQQERG